MKSPGHLLLTLAVVIPLLASEQQETPGHSIGQVSTTGHLIVIELDRAALGQANLFDLVGRTLRFSPGIQSAQVLSLSVTPIGLDTGDSHFPRGMVGPIGDGHPVQDRDLQLPVVLILLGVIPGRGGGASTFR